MSPASTSSSGLEGTWVPVAADVSGQALVVDRGDYRVDDTVHPQTMDIVGVSGPYAGRVMLAIYELEGNRLRVCYDLETGARPQDMEADGDELLLSITYARASTVLS